MTHNNFLVSLSDHACVSVTGADATTFLHGQFSADLLSVPGGGGCLTAWCTPKGRVITTLFAFRLNEGWSLILPADLATRVTQRLRMFVLRARVELRPAAPDTVLLGLGVDAAGALGAELHPRLRRLPTRTPADTRYLISLSQAEHDAVRADLAHQAAAISARAWATHDVECGLPWVDAGTTEQFLPQELDLERWQGLSYTKGCYPGQEIVARSRYRGTVKRGLHRLQAPAALQPALQSGLRLVDAAGTPVATVLYTGATGTGGIPLIAVVNFAAPPFSVLYREPGGAPISVAGATDSAA